jgi:hypothetical protein
MLGDSWLNIFDGVFSGVIVVRVTDYGEIDAWYRKILIELSKVSAMDGQISFCEPNERVL